MGWACAGCKQLRRELGEPFDCKRHRRLCQLVDTGLMSQFPARGLRWYLDRNRELAIGHVTAVMRVELMDVFPEDGVALVRLARELHLTVFACWPEGAGELRREPSYYGAHGLRALEPEKVEQALRGLGDSYGPRFREPDSSPAELSKALASFLYRWFRIHPFFDGNGRVGRLLIALAARVNGLDFDALGRESGKDRRRYLAALKYADRRAASREHPPKNPYTYLARWVHRSLQRRIDPEEEAAEMDSLFDDIDQEPDESE